VGDLPADATRIRTNPLESGFFARPSVVGRGPAKLAENLAHPGHEFWTDSFQVPTAVKVTEARLQGYEQLAEAYLLSVAHRRKGVLATFDRGLRPLAGDALLGSLEIVPAP